MKKLFITFIIMLISIAGFSQNMIGSYEDVIVDKYKSYVDLMSFDKQLDKNDTSKFQITFIMMDGEKRIYFFDVPKNDNKGICYKYMIYSSSYDDYKKIKSTLEDKYILLNKERNPYYDKNSNDILKQWKFGYIYKETISNANTAWCKWFLYDCRNYYIIIVDIVFD